MTYYLTHDVRSARGAAIVDARALCDSANRRMMDSGRDTEADARAELDDIPRDVAALYGIRVESSDDAQPNP